MKECIFVFETFGDEQLKLHSAIETDEKANNVILKNKLFKNTVIISPIT
jgi:hypothetical protein